MGTTLNNIGMILWQGGDHDGALSSYKRALEILEQMAPESVTGTLAYNVGRIHYDRGEFKVKLLHFTTRRWRYLKLLHLSRPKLATRLTISALCIGPSAT